jgi:hypothetical protein
MLPSVSLTSLPCVMCLKYVVQLHLCCEKCCDSDVFALACQEDPREVEAGKYDLNYIGLDGNIGCMGLFSLQRLSSVLAHRRC